MILELKVKMPNKMLNGIIYIQSMRKHNNSSRSKLFSCLNYSLIPIKLLFISKKYRRDPLKWSKLVIPNDLRPLILVSLFFLANIVKVSQS